MISPIASLTLDQPQIEDFARGMARELTPGDVITLAGDVGAGKTTFARALIQALAGREIDVTSPTFPIMQSYPVTLADGAAETLWHLDLYRLGDAGDLQALGLEDVWPHVTLVEWPAVAAGVLPPSRLEIAFAFATQARRDVRLSGDALWRRRLEKTPLSCTSWIP